MKMVDVNSISLKELYDRFGNMEANPEYHGEEGRAFFNAIYTKSFFIIDISCGIVRVSNYRYGHCAHIHALFDKNPYKYIESIKLDILDFMETFHILRLEAAVPVNIKSISRVLEKLGFSHEGTLRNYLYNGTLCKDADMYSAIRGGYDVKGYI